MRLCLEPLPAGAAEPLSLMHAACFPDDPWDAVAIARLLAFDGVFGYLAWRDGNPAGFVIARNLGCEAEILSLGVLPEQRRGGVGRALLDRLRAEAVRRRIGSIVLEVAADNEAARRLYRAIGFNQVGARASYYRRGEGWIDALILRLPTEAEADPNRSCRSLR